MIPKHPNSISRDLKRKANHMTNGVIKDIPVSCLKMPMLSPRVKTRAQGRDVLQSK